MRIELYGIARIRAGLDWVEIEASTLQEAVRALAEQCPGLVPEVVVDERLADGFLASLDGRRFLSDESTQLEPSATLLIVSAEAGG